MRRNESRSAGPEPDLPLVDIADYVVDYYIGSPEAYTTARYMLLDSIGCALLAMRFPECVKHLGPVVPGAVLPGGVRVPGTHWELDPVQAAYNIGVQIRWLDYNDSWLAAEWGHPSDNLGAILAVADYASRRAEREGGKPLTIRDVLTAAIKAHEIQGVYALQNSFNQRGLDHVVLVRLASTALATHLLGGGKTDIITAVSNSWIDHAPLRVYRHAPNTGPRKRWAAGDAARRAVTHALNAMKGCAGYPTVLSAPTWGFYDVACAGQPFRFDRGFGSYVIENTLFRISFPAQIHAQTAVECALDLHGQAKDRIGEIERIEIETHEAALRLIDRSGPLADPDAREHCLQYVVAIALLHGRLEATDYADAVASDPRVDALRARMQVRENPHFTRDYLDPDKRHVGTAVQVFFRDGSSSQRVVVDCPLGHRDRRGEGVPALLDKFERALAGHLPAYRTRRIFDLVGDTSRFETMPVHRFMDLLTP